jgi:hypothetical protein
MVTMSSDAGGYGRPLFPQPPPYGYAGPPRYPPPGYGPPGYGPPGYPPFGPPPALKPGIIPLRPLTLSEIFNAAITYVRTNPKAALGLTAIVVVIGQVVALLLQIGPLATSGVLSSGMTGAGADQISDSSAIGVVLSSFASIITTALAGIVLSGMLTVVVGRAVFGATIGIGEAWQRVRGRLLPLLAITAIEAVGATLLIALAVGVVVAVGVIAGDAAAFVIGGLMALGVTALLAYLYTMLSFAPTLIVLERLGLRAAIVRSFALVKNGFWRILGIRLLAVFVVGLVSGALTMPFSLVGQILLMVGGSTAASVIAIVLISLGGAIGQIITAPFSAGVVVLLYTDRRIRAEAFDLVLQTGAMNPAATTDELWLTSRR